jgi:hypothetical protein
MQNDKKKKKDSFFMNVAFYTALTSLSLVYVINILRCHRRLNKDNNSALPSKEVNVVYTN